MPQEIKNTLDFKNVGKIVNLPDGVDPQDAATVHQLATGSGTAAWGGITGTLSSQTDLQSALDDKENIITAGSTSQYWRGDKTWQDFNSTVLSATLAGISIAGGAVTSSDGVLTAFGKLQNQINGVLGGATYQGVWNASSNTPSLAAGTGTKGYYYVVSVNGSTNLDGITDWKVGDWAIFNGTTWDKVDNTDAVSSVNGAIGAISLAGTADRITVSGTTFNIAATYAGQSSINTLGTIATGTWNAGVIGPTYGGTGLSSYAKGDVLIATGTNVLGVVSAASTDGYVFTWDAASGLPMWKAAGGGSSLPDMTGNAGKFLITDGTVASWAGTPLWTALSSNIYYNTGNVGIGNTSPSTQLNIKSVATNATKKTLARFFNPGTGVGTGARLTLGYIDNDTNGASLVGGYFNGADSFALETAGVQRLFINTTGLSASVPIITTTSLAAGTDFTLNAGGIWKWTSPATNVMRIGGNVPLQYYWEAHFFGTVNNFKSPQDLNTDIVLNVNGTAAQSANLQIWTNSTNVVSCVGPTGSINAGSSTENSCAILQASSTTKGLLPPRMTTTQKSAIASPAEGLVVYDNTLHKLCVYTGSAWETITSA